MQRSQHSWKASNSKHHGTARHFCADHRKSIRVASRPQEVASTVSIGEGEEAEKRPKEKEERRGTIVGIPWLSPSRHCWKQTKTHWSRSPDFDPLHESGCYWKNLQKQKSCGRSSEKPFSKGSCLHTWNPYPSTQMGIANRKAELQETNALMDCLLM